MSRANWQAGVEERYNRLFRAARLAGRSGSIRQQEFEEQETSMAAKTATATAPVPAKKIRELSEEELLAAPEKD